MKRIFLVILAAAGLAAGCGRRTSAAGDGAAQEGGSAQETVRASAPAAREGVMQDAGLTRSVEELRRDSINLRRIDSLALCPQPSFATPRQAVEAFLRAYVSVDAPLLFHVSETGFGPIEPQQVMDYQHMMEGLARRHLLPTDFAVTEVGEQGEVCPVIVDLRMADGSAQAMHTEAYRLPSGRWRSLLK